MGLFGFIKRGKKISGMPPKGFPPMPKPQNMMNLDSSEDDLPELPPIEDNDFNLENDKAMLNDVPPLPSRPIGNDSFLENDSLDSNPIQQAQQSKPVLRSQNSQVEVLPHHYAQGNSLFVDSGDYRDFVVASENVKEKVKDAENILHNLHKLKEKKEDVLKKWQLDFVDIQRKLSYLDKALFEHR